jgi:ABC-type Mn2+/Zn2+ transport system permease subunit
MNWLIVIIIVAVISGIIGYFKSPKKEDAAKNALSSAVSGGVGCGFIILQIFLWGLGIFILIYLFLWLFS